MLSPCCLLLSALTRGCLYVFTLQLGGTDIRRNTKENPEKIYNHVDLCHMLDIRDTEPNGGAAEGTKVAGGRAYFLKGHGCMLNQALINYGLVYLAKRGYTQMHCPFFMRQSMMGQCAQLSQFDEVTSQAIAFCRRFYGSVLTDFCDTRSSTRSPARARTNTSSLPPSRHSARTTRASVSRRRNSPPATLVTPPASGKRPAPTAATSSVSTQCPNVPLMRP